MTDETSENPEAPSSAADASPAPESASLPAPPPVAPPAGVDDPLGAPTTASGLPNPHGLPEIAVERPEVAVGGAFAGGLVLAMIFKRLAR